MASPATDRAALVARLRAAGCVFAEDEAELLLGAAATPAALEPLLRRRLAGEPLEQVLGWAEFCGHRVAVAPGVFVPRQRTALLVDAAVSVAGERPGILELCCGTGAILLAVAHRVAPGWSVAADIDPAAVACARRNLAPVGARVLAGDLFEPIPADLRGRVDLLLANAPYVPADRIGYLPPEARLYEPAAALCGGPDGLDLLRRIAEAAPDWLAPGGHLLVETNPDQAGELSRTLVRHGLTPEARHDEESGTTVLLGRREATTRGAFRRSAR
ncbi:putative protein N(5)-glutamine methyltransferase [Plantactinospora siamensis]|uniref:Methyltransferase domain-containing protein n=1 Tax=Plantactinospora siamensis TaxID=555372 RepID=A0ABV6NT40_9ACTN